MEKITSHQVLDLMEAYQSVYVPQEDLNEELIWEEVEFWVNSLVEEGYDLSEYSWEDMYESYLEEQGRGSGSNPSQTNQSISGAQLLYGPSGRRQPPSSRPPTNVRGGSQSKPNIPAERPQSRFAGARDVAIAKAQKIQGSPVVGSKPPVRPAAAAPARPSAAPARPVARLSAPTAPRPAAAPARPTGAPVRPAAAAPVTVARPAAPTMGNPPLAPKPLPPIMGKPSLASQATELRAMQARSRQRQGLTQSFDPFDVVLGHLIDEGYADNEESALQIMTNMSEDWREDILDEGFKRMNRGKIEKQAKRLGGDKEIILRSLSDIMDRPEFRKSSTSEARKNRAGSGSEYRKSKELKARDDAQADIKKYGLH